jgi:shikimate dehydrogenase
MAALAALVGNAVDSGRRARYAAIIGVSPSKGARSPVLWNAAFDAHGIDAEMVPLDVAPEHLAEIIAALRRDARFLGGAVAAPYKARVWELLGDDVDDDVRAHGSVNAMHRDARARLVGGNTDGVGAVRAIAGRWPTLGAARALVLGLGGVGRPIATALARRGPVVATSRHATDRAWCEARGIAWVAWDDRAAILGMVGLVVNCTSLGDARHEGRSPLDAGALGAAAAGTCVYDVIYQPATTALLESARGRGLETCNGETMNLIQAECAFAAACPLADTTLTHRAMADVFRGL